MMFTTYDYTRTLMLKLDLAIPEPGGGCRVMCTFDQALEMVKQIDRITPGYQKVIYLVGWQYNGHDDRYPEFFEVNKHLKSPKDATARESLLRLVETAKNYHTVISYHINLSDAYPESALWQEYLDHGLILCGRNGQPKPTGVWNGRKAYQVRLEQEWKSGYFQKRVDRLLELLPIEEAGTIHIDAFFVRRGKSTSIPREKLARRNMIEYFNRRGVEVTSEFIYREWRSGIRVHFGKSDTIGLISAFWNPVFSPRDILRYPAAAVGFGEQCNALTPFQSLEWLIYGNMHGEDLLHPEDSEWPQKFLKRFITYTVPHYYLNQFTRLKIKGIGKSIRLLHSDGVVSFAREKRIEQNGCVLKCGNDLCLPEAVRSGSYLAYSETGGEQVWHVAGRTARVYRLTADGRSEQYDAVNIADGKIHYLTQPETAYQIEVDI